MPQIMRPTTAVESLRTEKRDYTWPAGPYAGVIETVDSRPLQARADGGPFGGFNTTDGERLNIMIGQNTALDPSNDARIGNQKQFVELVITDGPNSIFDSEEVLREASAWALLNAQSTALNLAVALGATTATNGHVSIEDTFIDKLRDGAYNGQPLGYVLYHNTFTIKNGPNAGTQRTKAEIETFMPAA